MLCFGFLTVCGWWSVMSLELHAGGHFNTSSLVSDSESRRFSAYCLLLTKSPKVWSCAFVCAQHFYSPQRSKRGRLCQKLITRKQHYVNSCSEKRERTMDHDKHKPRNYEKILCLWSQRWVVNHVCFAEKLFQAKLMCQWNRFNNKLYGGAYIMTLIKHELQLYWAYNIKAAADILVGL